MRSLIFGIFVSMSVPTFASVHLLQVVGMSPNSSLMQCSAFESAVSIAEARRNDPGFANEAKGILELFENMEGATAQLVFAFENEKFPVQFVRKNTGPIDLPVITSFRIPGVQEGQILNGIYSGQVILTLAGACPFYDAKTKSLRKNISVQEWEKYFELVR
ncbi:hypothetical protein D3C87_1220350 [compost metagenome]